MLTRVVYPMLLCCGLLLAGAGAVTFTQSSAAPYQRVVDIAFPVPGAVELSDDYHAGRADGVRAHRATDVFAPHGRPVHAAAAGTVSWLPARHPTAGYAVHVQGTDGLRYAYYHLGPHNGTRTQAYAPGLSEGSRVQRGELIGYVGDSGNAAGGRPHLHFEIHDRAITDPYGTHRLNPYGSLLAAQRRTDAPSRSGSRDGLLRVGDRGAEVAAWQTQLNTVRSNPIAVDGAFGPQTDRATRAFQRSAGITADGIVGPQTRRALGG
ncbi:MAG: peptidoglycan DD-metalloendopeptidase family protein [Egibacteraceae bacterium]